MKPFKADIGKLKEHICDNSVEVWEEMLWWIRNEAGSDTSLRKKKRVYWAMLSTSKQ